MDAIGPVIRLSHDRDMRSLYVYRDWSLDPNAPLVFYKPGKLLFQIDHPELDVGKRPQPTAVTARLVHVCEGGRIPPADELLQTGKDAICAYLLLADFPNEPCGELPF